MLDPVESMFKLALRFEGDLPTPADSFLFPSGTADVELPPTPVTFAAIAAAAPVKRAYPALALRRLTLRLNPPLPSPKMLL
jgi:hypothetical protein